MRAAVADDLIAVSPCRNIELPAIVVKPPQWFTHDQEQSILDELPSPWRTMRLLGFYAGLRWGELAGLHRHWIDQRRTRLFVVEVNTKSGIKEYPKSSKSRREAPLQPHVLEALERHIRGLEQDAVVFATVIDGRAGRVLSNGNWRRQTWWLPSTAPTTSTVTASSNSSRITRPTPCVTPALRGWSRRESRSMRLSTSSATRDCRPPSATPTGSRTRTRQSSEPGSVWTRR